MTLSHIDILDEPKSHLDRDQISIVGSWKIVQVRWAVLFLLDFGIIAILNEFNYFRSLFYASDLLEEVFE